VSGIFIYAGFSILEPTSGAPAHSVTQATVADRSDGVCSTVNTSTLLAGGSSGQRVRRPAIWALSWRHVRAIVERFNIVARNLSCVPKGVPRFSLR
jgi:hypothetical protein